MADILVTVCARGGSKGIPGKNIKLIAGKPLLAYTAAIAKKFALAYKADLAFSTDSESIMAVGKQYGLPDDYTRPAELGNDIVGKPEVIKDLMFFAEKKYGKTYDFIIDLDVTSPLRTLNDIEKCYRLIEDNPAALTVFTVNPCRRNPYFNMVEKKPDGFYGLVKPCLSTTRQHSPKVYDLNGSIYIYRRSALMCDFPRAITDRTLVVEMEHICFDLDEPEDYEYLSYLLENNKIPFMNDL